MKNTYLKVVSLNMVILKSFYLNKIHLVITEKKLTLNKFPKQKSNQ